MADLKGFARNIQVRSEKFEVHVHEMVRRVALAVDTAVVVSTPVDTGRARANWQVGLGSAPQGSLPEPASPGEGATSALTRAQNVVATYRGTGTIHIINNLHYIEALNNGHSRQAPAGFVGIAVVAGIEAVSGARGRLL